MIFYKYITSIVLTLYNSLYHLRKRLIRVSIRHLTAANLQGYVRQKAIDWEHGCKSSQRLHICGLSTAARFEYHNPTPSNYNRIQESIEV